MDIIKLIEESIEAEKKDKEKYKTAAQDIADPDTRAVLEQLAADEEEHEKKLRDRLKAIKLIRDMS